MSAVILKVVAGVVVVVEEGADVAAAGVAEVVEVVEVEAETKLQSFPRECLICLLFIFHYKVLEALHT